jgi:hypothetical protein
MRSKWNLDMVDSLRSEEHPTGPDSFDMDSLENEKEFVLQAIAKLAKSHLDVLHQPSEQNQHLYLITGEVFRLGESSITRLS